jgi:methionine aminotransferase
MQEFRKVHQFLVFSSNTPIQYALAEYLQTKEHYEGLPLFYEAKRDFFVEVFRQTKFKLKPTAGTYFQLLDYSPISDEPDTDFAVRLTREYGVASIPISVFYHKKTKSSHLRFCFAKNNEEIEKAAALLMKL